jgi:hypothetical protein
MRQRRIIEGGVIGHGGTSLNWKRGFFRLWALGTVLWLALWLIAGWGSITAPIYPPGVEPPRAGFSSPQGFPPPRAFGPLATPEERERIAAMKSIPPEEAYKAAPQPTPEPASPIVILGRLANVVWRVMIPPLVILAIGWAFSGFAGSNAKPSS